MNDLTSAGIIVLRGRCISSAPRDHAKRWIQAQLFASRSERSDWLLSRPRLRGPRFVRELRPNTPGRCRRDTIGFGTKLARSCHAFAGSDESWHLFCSFRPGRYGFYMPAALSPPSTASTSKAGLRSSAADDPDRRSDRGRAGSDHRRSRSQRDARQRSRSALPGADERARSSYEAEPGQIPK